MEISRAVTLQTSIHPAEAERLAGKLAAQFNCVELWMTEFSPVMGYVCGTGTLGFAFYLG